MGLVTRMGEQDFAGDWLTNRRGSCCRYESLAANQTSTARPCSEGDFYWLPPELPPFNCSI